MNVTLDSEELTLINNVYEHINHYRYLLLAFSGGLDSTVLLDILAILCNEQYKSILNIKTKHYLRVIHINHGINIDADRWVLHCKKQCKLYGLSFNSLKINFFYKQFSNIEELARYNRYKLLYNSLFLKEILLTAHNLDDQVETFLLALKNGSGPRGLSSMPTVRKFNDKLILRPLLGNSRLKLENYSLKRKLCCIDDPSNTDNRFDRNFFRNNIIPLLKTRWPQINTTIVRSALLCAEQEKLLDELLEDTLLKITFSDGSLCIKSIFLMSNVKRNALLRRWLLSQSKGYLIPSRKKILYIWQHIICCRNDASPILKLGDRLLRRFKHRLYLLPLHQQQNFENIIIKWNTGQTKVILPQNLGFLINVNKNNYYNYNTLVTTTIVRAPLENENVLIKFINKNINFPIYIIGRKHSRKLKKIWQELNVPTWVRKQTPLVFYNKKLISALGVFITKENNISNNNLYWKIKWYKKKSNC